MQTYIGVNSSLYSTLAAQSVIYLEQASTLTDYGRFSEALHIYDHALLPQKLHPAVVLERAELASRQYKAGELFRIPDEALRDASRQGLDLDAPEFRLMAIIRASAAYSHKGVCEPAVSEISRAQLWLNDLPVTDYTDLQVRVPLP